MHETDMTKALIATLRDWWDAQPGQPTISKVHLIVGKFTCVEPVSLQFAFDVQTRNTFLEGAKLEIQETPLIGYCHTCEAEYQPEIGIHYACPTCQSPLEDIRSGRELKIDRVEYKEPLCTKPSTQPSASTCSTPTKLEPTTTAPILTSGGSPVST